jgi:hypothetical protein
MDWRAYTSEGSTVLGMLSFLFCICLDCRSGPVRYDFDAANGCWVCVRDGHKLHELLQKELSGLLGGELSL